MVCIKIEYEYYTSIIVILFIRPIAQQKLLIIGCLTFSATSLVKADFI